MRIEEIEIWTSEPDDDDREVIELGHVRARVTAATLFSKTPTIEDVNLKLREQAARLGAHAVLYVRYDRGVSATSWKALTARGLAVKFEFEPDEKTCPYCAETVKAAAIKCKHCGSDLATA
jgi:hypothetical protein